MKQKQRKFDAPNHVPIDVAKVPIPQGCRLYAIRDEAWLETWLHAKDQDHAIQRFRSGKFGNLAILRIDCMSVDAPAARAAA